MNKGDKFVVELECDGQSGGNYNANVSRFILVGSDDRANFWNGEVRAAAQAYAEKVCSTVPQPAPVAPDWQPKVGERVLVVGTLRAKSKTRASVSFDIEHENLEQNVPLSSIVGPAPVRARFAVGDEVYYKPGLEIVTIAGVAEHDSWVIKPREFARVSFVAADADLITLAEARERLEK